jgi:hypothetical protein
LRHAFPSTREVQPGSARPGETSKRPQYWWPLPLLAPKGRSHWQSHTNLRRSFPLLLPLLTPKLHAQSTLSYTRPLLVRWMKRDGWAHPYVTSLRRRWAMKCVCGLVVRQCFWPRDAVRR